MADESLKTIKQKLTELNKLVKQGKELTAVQEQELRTLRAQKKELSSISGWQKKILDNEMSSVKQEQNLTKLLEEQAKKQEILKSFGKDKKAAGAEYFKEQSNLKSLLEDMDSDSQRFADTQERILELQELQAAVEAPFEEYEASLTAQIGFQENLAKIQQDLINGNMLAVKGELAEADIASRLVDIAAAEAAIEENTLSLSKEELAIAKAQLRGAKSGLTAQEDMSKYAEMRGQAESKIDEISGGVVGKMKGMAGTAKKLGPLLMTPAGAMAAIAVAAALAFKFMFDLVKAGMELQKELGLSVQETFKLQATLMAAGWEMKGLGIDSAEIKETAMALVGEFGSFENVTKETLVTMSKMNTEFGIAGTTSATLLGIMESVSGSSREALLSQMASTAELARAAGVAPGQVMADVAENADFFAQFAKDGGANVMEAAIEAKKLGLNLGTVSNIAESLLDFESSIEKQMEASMMLGRNINTDAARRLALEGDLVGMQKEVMKQVGNEAEFNEMNTLQRKAMADAFGLTVSELGKMVRDQEVLNNMTAEERAARDAQAKALEATKKKFLDIVAQVKQLGMQLFMMVLPAFKLIAGAISILFTLLSPFIEGIKVLWPILSPIVKILGAIVLVMYALAAAQWLWNIAMAANPVGLIILGIVGLIGLVAILMKKFKGFGDVVKKALDMAFAPLLWAWDMLKSVGSFIGGLFGGGETKTASPAVSMAEGGVVNSATTAQVGEAGPEAVVPLGDKFDLSKIEEKLVELIAINKLNLPAINKGVKEIGVAG